MHREHGELRARRIPGDDTWQSSCGELPIIGINRVSQVFSQGFLWVSWGFRRVGRLWEPVST